jgi:hypothetical protein
MTLYDLLTIIFTIVGVLLGVGFGRTYGPFGGMLGAVVGGLVGGWIGRIPAKRRMQSTRKGLSQFTTEKVRELLYRPALSPGRWPPNLLLMELQARGEDLNKHVELILSMLEADPVWQRAFGYGALLSAYPHLAHNLKGYRPAAPVDDCRTKVGQLRKQVRQSMSENAGKEGETDSRAET